MPPKYASSEFWSQMSNTCYLSGHGCFCFTAAENIDNVQEVLLKLPRKLIQQVEQVRYQIHTHTYIHTHMLCRNLFGRTKHMQTRVESFGKVAGWIQISRSI